MPKISNKTITIYKENGGSSYDVNVMYLSKVGFYIPVPEPLLPAFALLSEEQHSQYKTCFNKLSSAREKNAIVIAESEKAVIEYAQTAFNFLAKLSIIERPVIVVYFSESKVRSVGHESNEGYEKQGFEYGLCYCIEVKVSQEGKPRYEKRTLIQPLLGKSYEVKTELNLWGNGFIIIDDTQESRDVLEHTYKLYRELKLRLSSFLTDGDKLVELIASNQKLIG